MLLEVPFCTFASVKGKNCDEVCRIRPCANGLTLLIQHLTPSAISGALEVCSLKFSTSSCIYSSIKVKQNFTTTCVLYLQLFPQDTLLVFTIKVTTETLVYGIVIKIYNPISESIVMLWKCKKKQLNPMISQSHEPIFYSHSNIKNIKYLKKTEKI